MIQVYNEHRKTMTELSNWLPAQVVLETPSINIYQCSVILIILSLCDLQVPPPAV